METEELILTEDLKDTEKVVSLLSQLDEVYVTEDMCSNAKVTSLGIVFGRHWAGEAMRKRDIRLPPFGEIVVVDGHDVIVLPQALAVFITFVTADEKPSLIRRVVAEVAFNPSLDSSTKRLIERSALGERIVTLTSEETESAKRKAVDHYEACLYERFKNIVPDDMAGEKYLYEAEARYENALQNNPQSIARMNAICCIECGRKLVSYDAKEYPIIAQLIRASKEESDPNKISVLKIEALSRVLGRIQVVSDYAKGNIELLPFCECHRFDGHEVCILPQISLIFVTHVPCGKEYDVMVSVVSNLLRDHSLGWNIKRFIQWCSFTKRFVTFSISESKQAALDSSFYSNKALYHDSHGQDPTKNNEKVVTDDPRFQGPGMQIFYELLKKSLSPVLFDKEWNEKRKYSDFANKYFQAWNRLNPMQQKQRMRDRELCMWGVMTNIIPEDIDESFFAALNVLFKRFFFQDPYASKISSTLGVSILFSFKDPVLLISDLPQAEIEKVLNDRLLSQEGLQLVFSKLKNKSLPIVRTGLFELAEGCIQYTESLLKEVIDDTACSEKMSSKQELYNQVEMGQLFRKGGCSKSDQQSFFDTIKLVISAAKEYRRTHNLDD